MFTVDVKQQCNNNNNNVLLRCLRTHSSFPMIIIFFCLKEDNFCDFPFVALDKELSKKESTLNGKKFLLIVGG